MSRCSEKVVLLMGGNVGDVSASLHQAVELLRSRVGSVVRLSSEVESEPWGFEVAQVTKFKNQAVILTTELQPETLLDRVQQIEAEVGRDRAQECREKAQSGEQYASRRIDIDIIFYGEQLHKSDRLQIPHPLMAQREFVLRPLVEIAGEWRHPILGRSCTELYEDLKQKIVCKK